MREGTKGNPVAIDPPLHHGEAVKWRIAVPSPRSHSHREPPFRVTSPAPEALE